MLRQMKERRFGKDEDMQGGFELDLASQTADNLTEVEDDSVDVVISLQSVEKMLENGVDWKKKRAGSNTGSEAWNGSFLVR